MGWEGHGDIDELQLPVFLCPWLRGPRALSVREALDHSSLSRMRTPCPRRVHDSLKKRKTSPTTTPRALLEALNYCSSKPSGHRVRVVSFQQPVRPGSPNFPRCGNSGEKHHSPSLSRRHYRSLLTFSRHETNTRPVPAEPALPHRRRS
jgi:hypothetical protein